MAKYDDRKLYWIKLTDNFITSDTVDFLMEQKDGSNYVVLYQMLCLKTINNNGELSRQLGEVIIPYDEEKIQRDCKWFSIDTVRCALELYKKLGLIFYNANGYLQITNFERLIGSQTVGAEKKQEQIARRQNALLEGKKMESYDQILDIFGCKGAYREAVLDFIKHCLMNGVKITNERLNHIMVRLDLSFQDDDTEKIKYIRNAISKGYKYLECEIDY